MGCNTDKEREFYLAEAVKSRCSIRELKRQMDSALFERTRLSDSTNESNTAKSEGLSALIDGYLLEFLDLTQTHQTNQTNQANQTYKEKDLRKTIIESLKQFMLGFAKDFAFIDDEYRIQLGNRDFFIDLLFFNRSLQCLVAIELKIGEFVPERLGKMELYLEALDQDVKKSHENPSVGLIICSKKDEAVIEYALSRSMSPAMATEYMLHLPDKAILENKLRELAELAESVGVPED
jgi:predicted nuclease of restriction endonuclease-like (RecB) superfamily